MGEQKIKETIKPRMQDELPFEIELYARDGQVANRALELLGKTPEVRLFMRERHELTYRDGGLVQTQDAPQGDRIGSSGRPRQALCDRIEGDRGQGEEGEVTMH